MVTQEFSTDSLATAPRNRVTARSVVIQGRQALRVVLEPGLGSAEMIDKPTFVIVPVTLANGVIEVDILSRLVPDAPPIARGFAGIACRINPEASAFEAVYLRPLNGRPMNPPPPRDQRAVQYFAYPDWDFQRLRDCHPDGSYEAGADIRPDTWMHLKLATSHHQVTASVDGRIVLTVQGKVPATQGAVGLWVDIGTEAFFSNLRVSA